MEAYRLTPSAANSEGQLFLVEQTINSRTEEVLPLNKKSYFWANLCKSINSQ